MSDKNKNILITDPKIRFKDDNILIFIDDYNMVISKPIKYIVAAIQNNIKARIEDTKKRAE